MSKKRHANAYSKHGKITKQLATGDFETITRSIPDKQYRAFVTLLYYSGVRVSELLKAKKEDFSIEDAPANLLIWDVGERLKHSKKTDPLMFPLLVPLLKEAAEYIKHRHKDRPLFDFNRVTAWRLMNKYFHAYPHYFRLNLVTGLLEKGFPITKVMSWTGHKQSKSIDSYIGKVAINEIAKSFLHEKKGEKD